MDLQPPNRLGALPGPGASQTPPPLADFKASGANPSTDQCPATPRGGPDPAGTRTLGNRSGRGAWTLGFAGPGGTAKPLHAPVLSPSANRHRLPGSFDPFIGIDPGTPAAIHHLRQWWGKL